MLSPNELEERIVLLMVLGVLIAPLVVLVAVPWGLWRLWSALGSD